ncbi:MAG: glycerophosphodiester phosphodiesterase family protein, partial [Deltaproteobacteria bacterium]|nr:glycerophosphodiester phosphodiesterase family protein [Deltaproteobacteria bacterium]
HGRIMARIGRWEGLSLEAANLQHRLAAPDTVGALHALGLRVYVFTVDGEEAVAGLQRIGVDGVFANDPGPLLRRWPARND